MLSFYDDIKKGFSSVGLMAVAILELANTKKTCQNVHFSFYTQSLLIGLMAPGLKPNFLQFV